MTTLALDLRRWRLDRLPSWALIGAACGVLADIAVLPSAVRALLLVTFMLVGPGSVAVAPFAPDLPPLVIRALVPVVGFALVMLAVSVPLLLGVWSARLVLLALAVLTAAGGLVQAGARARADAAG